MDDASPLNPTDTGVSCHRPQPKEEHLRTLIFETSLSELVGDLFINTSPIKTLANERGHLEDALLIVLSKIVQASYVNTLEIELSLKHRFSGQLEREKVGRRDVTSLSLFVDNVERLLRDLYGESDEQAITVLRHAVAEATIVITRYGWNSLGEEYGDPPEIHYVDADAGPRLEIAEEPSAELPEGSGSTRQ
jgi:hypothetical protein